MKIPKTLISNGLLLVQVIFLIVTLLFIMLLNYDTNKNNRELQIKVAALEYHKYILEHKVDSLTQIVLELRPPCDTVVWFFERMDNVVVDSNWAEIPKEWMFKNQPDSLRFLNDDSWFLDEFNNHSAYPKVEEPGSKLR